jgi:DNA-binding NtrC family response regulator
LSVYPIVLPTLRERKEDIPLLVTYFVGRFSERHRKAITHVPEHLLKDLQQRPWPGNIRELQNVIERAVIATPGNVLRLPPRDLALPSSGAPIRTLRDAERAHIAAALQETKGVVGGWNGAAARLGLSRTTLIAKMQKLGLAEMGHHSARRRTEASGICLGEAI